VASKRASAAATLIVLDAVQRRFRSGPLLSHFHLRNKNSLRAESENTERSNALTELPSCGSNDAPSPLPVEFRKQRRTGLSNRLPAGPYLILLRYWRCLQEQSRGRHRREQRLPLPRPHHPSEVPGHGGRLPRKEVISSREEARVWLLCCGRCCLLTASDSLCVPLPSLPPPGRCTSARDRTG
jgi:hypothetical protein